MCVCVAHAVYVRSADLVLTGVCRCQELNVVALLLFQVELRPDLNYYPWRFDSIMIYFDIMVKKTVQEVDTCIFHPKFHLAVW